MGDLNITDIKPSEAEHMNFLGFDISLKMDGTLIYFKDKRLFSPRCDRSERFNHILRILIENNFPDCIGEMFIDKKGSNVFDVSKSENWSSAVFMPFDLLNENIGYHERQRILKEKVCCLNNNFIKPMICFNNFKDGWSYVKENQCEGLVIRNSYKWYKVKILQEVKVEIVGHEKGKDKGTFVLSDGNRISGTSMQFVLQYVDIKNRGNKAIGEIEYPFLTKDGHYFQPRLRQIVEEGEQQQ